MIDINAYMASLVAALRKAFQDELLYVGLQGSYLRNEATENSDIDAMVVLSSFTVSSLERYKAVIDALPHADKACGFICGLSDLRGWNQGEIAHLCCSTKDVYGSLRDILPAFSREALLDYIKLSAGNIYHEICHRRVHRPLARSIEALPAVYRGVFFALQDLYFYQTGEVVLTKSALLNKLTGIDRDALAMAAALKENPQTYDFDAAYSLLFDWCRHIFAI